MISKIDGIYTNSSFLYENQKKLPAESIFDRNVEIGLNIIAENNLFSNEALLKRFKTISLTKDQNGNNQYYGYVALDLDLQAKLFHILNEFKSRIESEINENDSSS